ncbi:ATP-binding cassette domain-containing protein, partial [Acinetobacter faecalis]|uniref:ATP-binding cassette domain-containing protein n=1 Tax=Acinetobacter faecalis TaxID=2665161 RepID=UPI002A90E854
MKHACIISNLNLTLSNQDIFKQLSFTLYSGQTSALIGRNGLGKSILFKILHLQQQATFPYTGQIVWDTQHSYLGQLERLNVETIAQALNVENLHTAFQRIENNTACFEDYDLVENTWDLPQEWQKILCKAQLPIDLNFLIKQLSEGQKTKLALCYLFLKKDHYLLLDEPSNHLDIQAKKWLIESILDHPAGVFLISHNHQLLDQVHHIYALSELGLQHISGNYKDYIHQQHIYALSQSIQQEKREIKQLKQQQHETLMKAQKRQRKGIKLRESSSQSKILLNSKKETAEKSIGKLKSQQNIKIDQSKVDLKQKQSILEKVTPQNFEFHIQNSKQGEILRITDLKLPFTSTKPIKFSIQAGEQIHLKGANGIGKSTLLKLIYHHQIPEIYLNAQCLYLDQNFSLLNNKLTVLDNLQTFNPNISEVEWRKLLGQLRIRGERALLKMEFLSGGEKLKVALLGIS